MDARDKGERSDAVLRTAMRGHDEFNVVSAMEQRVGDGLSPYHTFSRSAWAALREDTPMTLTPEEVTRLRSMHDRLRLHEGGGGHLPAAVAPGFP